MRSAWIGVCLIGLALTAAPAWGGEAPVLLADVNREPLPISPRGEPSGFFELGGRLLFSTADPDSLDQAILWSTDGTARGTVQVSTTLCTAHCAGITPLGTWHGITLLKVDFERDIPFRIPRLGRTDGTAAGTFLLTGDLLNEDYYVPLTIQVPPGSDGFLFSYCSNSNEACQLWRSDGTRAGTALFQGTDGQPFFDPRAFTVWRDRLYFVASSTPGGNPGLWSTDGTPEGTHFIHEARDPLVAIPSHLFFTAGEAGEDLWATNGSPEGTRLLADFAPPPCDDGCPSPDVDSITASGDAVYFEARRPGGPFEVWRSDGTGEGTGPVLELPRRIVWARGLQRIGGHWLFRAAKADDDAFLWTVDDGFTRAAPLTDCAGGPCPEPLYQPIESPAPGIWLFVGFDDQGWGLWSTDGTGPGTRRLVGVCSDFDVSPGGPDIFPSPRGLIYFRACPAGGFGPDNNELWVTDGTAKGTHRAGGQVSAVGFFHDLAWFGSSPADQPAAELWATDGTPGHERKVTTLRRYRSGSDPQFQPFRDGALFVASPAGGARMWTSDGTPGGTFPLQEPSPDVQRFFFNDFLGLGSPVQLFKVFRQKGEADPKAGTELWRTDGTLQGTRSLALLPFAVESWLSWKGGGFFASANPPHCSIWHTDGTAAGTREVLSEPSGPSCPYDFTRLGSSRFLFFASRMDAGQQTIEIFLSDGTPAGTRRIASFPGQYVGAPPVEIDGTVYFQVIFDTSSELWQTDGTGPGTHRAAPLRGVSGPQVFQGSLYVTASLSEEHEGGRGLFRIVPGGDSVLLARILHYSEPTLYDPPSFAPAGDRLLFLFAEVGSDAELWATDGTPEGTGRVRYFQPFPANPIPQPDPLVSAGGRVFFAASDGIHGRELWESDGTPEGTRMAVDLAPGGYSSIPSPSSLAVSNGYLFFAADDGKTGVEPWALPLEP
jgi:ELWxxDGT repeat protein